MRPSTKLTVGITTDKDTYEPGDTVKFEVSVSEAGSSSLKESRYVSIFVTDDTVFDQIPLKE